jgi:hypothetical protein
MSRRPQDRNRYWEFALELIEKGAYRKNGGMAQGCLHWVAGIGALLAARR